MVLQDFTKIKAVFLDVDGVLTDGTVLVTEQGEQLRSFSVKDGYAMQLAVKRGIYIAVVSGGKTRGVLSRLNSLGIQDVHLGVSDKLSTIIDLIEEWGVVSSEVLYMGDDIPDLACMKWVGLPVCPSDAAEEIKQVAKYISPKKGGKGCVRDVLEKILKLQQKWDMDKGEEV